MGDYHMYLNVTVNQLLVIGEIKMKRRLFVMFVVLALLAVSTSAVMADTDSGAANEFAYYNGQLYGLHIPSEDSSNPNQFTFFCYSLGPDLTDKPAGPTGTMYAILAEGASLDSCPDGTDKHDHLISAVPGVPGYAPRWNIKIVVEGPNFDASIIPVTSEQALLAAVDAGQLVIVDPPVPIVFEAPVIGLVE
jgi:hypothetical protein